MANEQALLICNWIHMAEKDDEASAFLPLFKPRSTLAVRPTAKTVRQGAT